MRQTEHKATGGSILTADPKIKDSMFQKEVKNHPFGKNAVKTHVNFTLAYQTNRVEMTRDGEDSGMLWLSFALSPGLQPIKRKSLESPKYVF